MSEIEVNHVAQLGIVKHGEVLARRGLDLLTEVDKVEITISEDVAESLNNRVLEILKKTPELPKGFFTNPDADPGRIFSERMNSVLLGLDRVQLPAGCTLDYVSSFDGKFVIPYIYCRREQERPLVTCEDFIQKFPTEAEGDLSEELGLRKGQLGFLGSLQFENTPIGCFQFAYFCHWMLDRLSPNVPPLHMIVTRRIFDLFRRNKFVSFVLGGLDSSDFEFRLPKVSIVGDLSEVTIVYTKNEFGSSGRGEIGYSQLQFAYPNRLVGRALQSVLIGRSMSDWRRQEGIPEPPGAGSA